MRSRTMPKRLLHLAVDLDDVVLDFFPGVVESFYREFGERVQFDGRPWGPDAEAFYKHPRFIEAGYVSWWDWLRDREWLWATFGTVPGAIGGIKTLRAQGHYVECVTSKPDWAEHNVWKWLGKWRPPFNQVTIVTNGQKKIDFTSAQVMIDDKPQTIQEFYMDQRTGILFDRSKPDDGTDYKYIGVTKVRRAHDWDHILQQVESIVNGTI